MSRLCALSEREAFALEVHGRPPSCKNHRHLSYSKAKRLAEEQGARWTGSNPDRLVILPPRVWRPVNWVMQLVDGVIQGRKGHFNCPAAPRGARGRNTSVLATNKPLPPPEELAYASAM